MAKGKKTGGRQKGTPNKLTRDVQAFVDSIFSKVDPIAADLTGITFDYARLKVRHGSLILESKEDMKRRGLRSPDKGDTLAMSCAVRLASRPPKQEEWRPMSWVRPSETSWMGG